MTTRTQFSRAPAWLVCLLVSLSLLMMASCGDPACPAFVQFVDLLLTDAQSNEPLSGATIRIAALSPNDSVIVNSPVITQNGEAPVEFFRQSMCTIELGRGVIEMEATPDTLISGEYSIDIAKGEQNERLQGPFSAGMQINGQLFNIEVVDVGSVIIPGDL